MPKGSPERTSARKEEIVKACEHLYQTMSFREINLKEIGKVTSFTRTSIYNYFQTKEEIFLELLKREYELWIEELQQIIEGNETLSKKDFAGQNNVKMHEQVFPGYGTKRAAGFYLRIFPFYLWHLSVHKSDGKTKGGHGTGWGQLCISIHL